MRKQLLFAACLLLAVLMTGLCACAGHPADVPAEPPVTSPAAESPVPEAAPEENEPSPGQAAEAIPVFQAALEQVLTSHILPDGTDCGYEELMDDGGNRFAVYDVDGDGKDELVILYTTTYMAGQTAGVFGYDETTKALTPELIEHPLLTFYTNGSIRADWSHNQGLSVSFWPYTLYRYESASDSYQAAGMADAWEKAFAPTDYDGNPYPDEVDVSGTGIVYFLMPGGEVSEVSPVDATAYEAWRSANLGDATEVQLPYQPLTREAIEQLG